MSGFLARFGRCRRGATAVEYGFILALICVAVIGIISVVGGKTAAMWTNNSARYPNVVG